MTDTSDKTTTFTRLHFDDPRATSYITCSNEAAKYAYKHFPNPYSVEWRAASAGYDAGRAYSAGIIAEEITRLEPDSARVFAPEPGSKKV
jgi:hypothetical protein